jgi:hypothetical protein
MKGRLFVALAIVCAMVSLTPSATVTAANTATVSLDPSSSCTQGRLQITVNLDVSRSREYGIATTSGGTVLVQFEHASGPGTTYSGGFNYGTYSAAQPAGTLIGLYGYLGQTPPSSSNTAEFFLAYDCSTLAVVKSCAGAYGSCPRDWPGIPTLASGFFNPGDNRLNPQAGDRIAVYCNQPDTIMVYGVNETDSRGFFLASFSNKALLTAGMKGIYKSVVNNGVVSISTDGQGNYWAAWNGGEHHADGQPGHGFAKGFQCSFPQ